VVGSTIPLTIAIPATPALAAAPADSDIVFCLSPAQRGQLADAAVSLKLASPGKQPGDVVVTTAGIATEISVERWRELRTDDFNRVCTALARSTRPAAAVTAKSEPTGNADDLGSTLTGLIPVAFGALLGGVTAAISSWWKDLTTARRALAADLTSSMRLLCTSTVRFLDSGAAPDDQVPARAALQLARADTLGAVRRVNLTYPGRPQPTELEQLLTAAGLERDMSLGWGGSTQERVDRAERLRASVDRMELLAARIASALQRRAGPFLPRLADPKPTRSDKAATE
jgi:hypothetical protein